ncbi:hypothetical protein Goshw_019240 [Gossypium schwendimanii]|uniref:Uncharacterized protein n=1 Tax=Gossypium schwendimanii TaxID=34291 RepID=A0A7J9KM15_GOSSC|nr:hypothetical protein [Gossypium schwendimanii]
MERGLVSLSWIHRGLHLTCPYQAESWAEGIERKLRFSWFLEWRALREAGFTEQRSSPALGSGRITSRFHLDPSWLNRKQEVLVLYISTIPWCCLLSLVTQACNLSGGIKVMEHGFDSFSWIHRGLPLNCPFQAESWAGGIERKFRFSWFLERRVLREAGFTEQRSSPALGSGRITSQFH